MQPCILRRRALLMVAMLPLVCLASMPLGYCICPSGRTAMVVGSRCVGCDCACGRQHACCRSSTSERSNREGVCACQSGCRRNVIAPTFTTAANFEWTPIDLSLSNHDVPPSVGSPHAVSDSFLASHTILPHPNLFLEHHALLL